MCWRFSLISSPKDIWDFFDLGVYPDWENPHYNISPSTHIPILLLNDGHFEFQNAHFGLYAHRDKKAFEAGSKFFINARSETLSEKPTFKDAYWKRRCLIPFNGYFEWKKEGKEKIPFYFTDDNQLNAFAGIYNIHNEKVSFSIITTQALPQNNHIHERAPVIMNEQWLKEWIMHWNFNWNKFFDAFEVSRWVSSPANNSIECIEKINKTFQ